MDKATKADTIEKLRGAFAEAPAVLLTHYIGLSVDELTELRIKLREAGASYRVSKNRLARIAIEGTDYEGLSDILTGPTGIAFSTDPVQAAKAVCDYAKGNEKLVIIGGGLGGQIIDEKGVEALSKMPSIDELRAKFLGLINQPPNGFVRTLVAGPSDFLGQLQAPANSMVGVLSAYQQKQAA